MRKGDVSQVAVSSLDAVLDEDPRDKDNGISANSKDVIMIDSDDASATISPSARDISELEIQCPQRMVGLKGNGSAKPKKQVKAKAKEVSIS